MASSFNVSSRPLRRRPFPSSHATQTPAEWEGFSRRVGVALARQRRSRGLSQQQVGEAIGVEPETVSRMETGVISPSLKRLYQLAAVLDCPMESLLGGASAQLHDLLLKLSAPLSILSDHERVFVIHQSLSLASWLAAGRGLVDVWPEKPAASNLDPIQWASVRPHESETRDRQERSTLSRSSGASTKDDDPQI